jgi:FMN phosphatase YigB (HAD superfamily)
MGFKGAIFDLDGTLLPMNQDAFVEDYMKRLASAMAAQGYDPKTLVGAIFSGIAAMTGNDGSRTNEAAFWDAFCAVFGPDARNDEHFFQKFYSTDFQKVQSVCGLQSMAADLIEMLKGKGTRRILATNPLFPALATHSRVRWAGLRTDDFEWITTFENSSFCKPNPDYYREILGKTKLCPEECIMVGNDVREDMIAGELGMQVFLLTDCLINKDGEDISRYPHGDFSALVAYLREKL